MDRIGSLLADAHARLVAWGLPADPVMLAAAAAALLLALGTVVWLVGRGRMRGRAARAPEPADRGVSSAERLYAGLDKTRRGFVARLGPLLGRGRLEREDRDAIEAALLAADVGVGMTTRLLDEIERGGADAPVRARLERALLDVLERAAATRPAASGTTPHVIMVVGVNGVGKTTTIGKLAARHVAAGRRTMLVAADTFRAAAIEQLGVWAERCGAELVRQQHGGDPGAVVHDGMRAALARKTEVVLIDTAGRLHTKSNLMEELRKVRRVMGRELAGAPHETLLVLDAVTGQNGLAQARAFLEQLEVTGIVLTKLDGTAKGGIVIAIAGELGIPIRYIGVGEGIADLQDFDPRAFVAALLVGAPEPSLDSAGRASLDS